MSAQRIRVIVNRMHYLVLVTFQFSTVENNGGHFPHIICPNIKQTCIKVSL